MIRWQSCRRDVPRSRSLQWAALVSSADEHSERRSEAGHGRPGGGGVQVEAVENLSAVVHREQFESPPVEPASIKILRLPYMRFGASPRALASHWADATLYRIIFFPVTSLSFWQFLVPWFRASVATPRD